MAGFGQFVFFHSNLFTYSEFCMNRLFTTFFCLLLAAATQAQSALRGVVTDDTGEALTGVTVQLPDLAKSTTTDASGKYSIGGLSNGTYRVRFRYTGYSSVDRSVTINNGDVSLDVTLLTDANLLGEIVVSTGSRSNQRTVTDSPLPIDILSANDVRSTGQPAFDRALMYRVPSFNTVQTPVNDATSLLDPYEIRNMGPSRTLVLINGKRKNASSLVYIQTSPGRGEGGADLSAIPTEAIERVEILRDGASAQYGSDAIAGVMNVILKERFEYGSVTLNTGITGKGDGERIGLTLNNGANYGDKGYLNYTVSLSHQALANRPGKVSAAAEADAVLGFDAPLADVQAFLNKYPDARNVNGDPEKAAARFLVNAGIPVSENTELYGNAAYVYKKVNSFANFRTPYWRGPANNPYAAIAANEGRPYEGYGPTFEGDLSDYHGTVGIRSEKNNWRTDVSFTTGGNTQLYTVENSRNRDLGLNSPLRFKPGGYSFRHNVGNIDVSKMLFDDLTFSIGTEFRQETYTVIEGDTASYVKGGADSFPGTRSDNASKNTRYNYGGYVGLAYDITEDFLIDGTARAERYSDFGNTFVYKLSSRYKLLDDRLTLRASYSTGFRAPMLHQIYLQIAQQSFVPGQGIQSKGIFNNNSTQAKLLGIPELKPEESTNFTAGFGYTANRHLSLSMDYYNIAVNDRIILGTEIDSTDTPNTPLNQVLNSNGIVAASFWTNGINTRTSGIDFVLSYRNLMAGSGKLGFNFAANYVITNELEGAKSTSDYEAGNVEVPNGNVLNPRLIQASGKSVFDYIQEALLLTSRPRYKAILGADYALNKVSFNLNNTLFGPTTFRQNGLDPNLKTVFKPAVVTDLAVNLDLSKNVGLGLNVNNIFNILPKWEFEALNAAGEAILRDPQAVSDNVNLITFNGRYDIVTYDGSQFSQLGTTFAANLTLRF
jgi:iron complex outermembrane receptor protein